MAGMLEMRGGRPRAECACPQPWCVEPCANQACTCALLCRAAARRAPPQAAAGRARMQAVTTCVENALANRPTTWQGRDICAHPSLTDSALVQASAGAGRGQGQGGPECARTSCRRFTHGPYCAAPALPVRIRAAAAQAAWRRPALPLGAAPCGVMALRQAGRRISRLRCAAGARRARAGRRCSSRMRARRRRGPDWRRSGGHERRMENRRLAALAALTCCAAGGLAGCALRQARRHLIGPG